MESAKCNSDDRDWLVHGIEFFQPILANNSRSSACSVVTAEGQGPSTPAAPSITNVKQTHFWLRLEIWKEAVTSVTASLIDGVSSIASIRAHHHGTR